MPCDIYLGRAFKMTTSVKNSYLEFPNAIVMRKRIGIDSWYEALLEFSEAIIQSDNYQASPPGFCIVADSVDEQNTAEFEFFASLGFDVNATDAVDGVSSVENLLVGDTLVLRKYDPETPIVQIYQELLDYAQSNDILISEDFYHVMFTLYGEPFVDVHAKILEA